MPQNGTKATIPPQCLENGWVDDYPHNDLERTCTNPCCMPEGYDSYPWLCGDGTVCKDHFGGRPARLRSKGVCVLCNPPK